MFYYRWTARFDGGVSIEQPADDRYSKHDDSLEHNPSAFRDILDEIDRGGVLQGLELVSVDGKHINWVNLQDGMFYINQEYFKLEKPGEELIDRKLIYYRTMEITNKNPEARVLSYTFGYEGKDVNSGRIVEKVVTIYE